MNDKPDILRRRGRLMLAFLAVLAAVVSGLDGRPGAVAADGGSGGRNDRIRFRNGDVLFGRLLSIDGQNSLRWSHPDVSQPITFRMANAVDLKLPDEGVTEPATTNTAMVRLTNDDELIGRLIALDGEKLVLNTPYAGQLTVPRNMVQFVQPRPPAATPIFEGPNGIEGWTLGNVSSANVETGQWSYRDGAFYATRAASIARDVKLPEVVSIEFDFAWRGSFHVAIALYTDYLHPVSLATKEMEPEFGGFYSLQLNNYYANLLAITQPDPIRYLGQAPMQPSFAQKYSAHVEIRVHKSKSLIALLIDGVLVKAWVDSQDFVGSGTAIRLVHQGQGSTRLSGLRVSEWDGQFEEKPTNPPDSRQDLVKLRNGDKIAGTLEFIRDGRMFFNMSGRTVEVPVVRVKQIEMAGGRLERPKASGRAIRAHFPRGGSLTLELEKLDDKGWLVRSPAFGKTVFLPQAFSRIQFDPGATLD